MESMCLPAIGPCDSLKDDDINSYGRTYTYGSAFIILIQYKEPNSTQSKVLIVCNEKKKTQLHSVKSLLHISVEDHVQEGMSSRICSLCIVSML